MSESDSDEQLLNQGNLELLMHTALQKTELLPAYHGK